MFRWRRSPLKLRNHRQLRSSSTGARPTAQSHSTRRCSAGGSTPPAAPSARATTKSAARCAPCLAHFVLLRCSRSPSKKTSPSSTVPRVACLGWPSPCRPGGRLPTSSASADNVQLLSAADALARLVTAEGDRWERFVWTITPEPRLHQHPARGKPAWPEIDVRGSVGMSADCIARNAYFRSERQTFIPMAGSGQAVFTIHVESTPLSDAVGSAETARRVHDALASMSVAVLAYRDLTHVREPLLHWLAARAHSEAPRP